MLVVVAAAWSKAEESAFPVMDDSARQQANHGDGADDSTHVRSAEEEAAIAIRAAGGGQSS